MEAANKDATIIYAKLSVKTKTNILVIKAVIPGILSSFIKSNPVFASKIPTQPSYPLIFQYQ